MGGVKSAYELAMERLGGSAGHLTDGQKQSIQEVEARLKAAVAEAEILFNQRIAAETDPAKAALMQQTRIDQTEKLRREAEAEKERIRDAGTP